LPNTDKEHALTVAESIRMAIAALAIPHKTSEVSDVITLSLGVASLVPTTEQNPETLINQADQALYTAKSQGRNRVVSLG
jgi:diguanylate cyclase (GGDEF)-like protein